MNNNYIDLPMKPDNKKKVVLVGGCFDILHYGHLSFLEQAKALGDHLIVLLEPDETIKRIKGEGRPFHTQEERKKMLLSIRHVDEVYMLPAFTIDREYFDLIVALHPNVIAITDGDPILDKKLKQAELIGAKTVIIPKVHSPSTSQIAKLLSLE